MKNNPNDEEKVEASNNSKAGEVDVEQHGAVLLHEQRQVGDHFPDKSLLGFNFRDIGKC